MGWRKAKHSYTPLFSELMSIILTTCIKFASQHNFLTLVSKLFSPHLGHFSPPPSIPSVSLVNKAVVDYFFVELGVERHFEALRHFLLMEDGEFAQSLSDLLFEKVMIFQRCRCHGAHSD